MTADLVYDRQVRLWGAAAQQRLSASRVLVTGRLGGLLGGECLKNLVLAGMNLVLHDDSAATAAAPRGSKSLFLREGEGDTGLSVAKACLPRVKDMNPLAHVSVLEGEVREPDVAKGAVALVLAVDVDWARARELETLCAGSATPLLVTSARGMLHGFAVLCLGPSWTFSVDKKVDDVVTTVTETLAYPTLEQVLGSSSFAKMLVDAKRQRMPDTFFVMAVMWQGAGKAAQPSQPNKRAKVDVGEEHVQGVLFSDTTPRGSPVLAAAGRSRAQFVHDVAAQCATWGADQDFSPVCTILGGLVGNEAIKIVTGKDAPVHNVLLVDGTDGSAMIRRVPIA